MSSDREVLLALYRATGGPQWLNNGGWNTDADISSWWGVEVRDGRVVELDLHENNLTGPIPKELAALKNLEFLHLSINQLTGSIPKELGQLTSLFYLDLSDNKLDGTIPRELFDIPTINYIDCRSNNLRGNLNNINISSRAEVLRWKQMVEGNPENELAHSYLWRAVENLTSLWHFLLPVLDDATDLWLLLETSGGSHRGLWWTCFIVFVIADIERGYTALFFLVSTVLYIFCYISMAIGTSLNINWGSEVVDVLLSILSFLAMQEVDRGNMSEFPWILLDSLLWTLFGSRARSSPFMKLYGQAGIATGDALRDFGLGLHGIDMILFFHPMRYFGEFLLAFPKRNRRQEVSNRHQATRREIAMVRAVGETLCVDPLFLALSVVTGGWDDNLTGFALVSALFSILELVTELQYYVNEAEAATPVVSATTGNDVESGDDGRSFRGIRPIESELPVRMP